MKTQKALFPLLLILIGMTMDKSPDITQLNSFSETELGAIIIAHHKNFTIHMGSLFSEPKEDYCYFYRQRGGLHFLFRFNDSCNCYQKIFEMKTGRGAEPAKFIDCNFDGNKDLLITLPTNGNYVAECKQIVLKKGSQFIEVTTSVSYPIFDPVDHKILSRIIAPNDTFITTQIYQWQGDELILRKKLKIDEEDYISKFGNLISN